MRRLLVPDHEVDLWRSTIAEVGGASRAARCSSVATRRARTRAALTSVVRAYEPNARVLSVPGSPPAVSGVELRISVSHAGSIIAIAVSRRRPIGVDIEPLGTCVDGSLARDALARGEQEELEQLAPSLRGEALLRAWVRKEAVLKAAGVGLLVEPSLVDVGIGRLARESVLVPGAGLFRIVDLRLPGYAGALSAGGPAPVRGRWVDAPSAPRPVGALTRPRQERSRHLQQLFRRRAREDSNLRPAD